MQAIFFIVTGTKVQGGNVKRTNVQEKVSRAFQTCTKEVSEDQTKLNKRMHQTRIEYNSGFNHARIILKRI
jgi:hypothetical protein